MTAVIYCIIHFAILPPLTAHLCKVFSANMLKMYTIVVLPLPNHKCTITIFMNIIPWFLATVHHSIVNKHKVYKVHERKDTQKVLTLICTKERKVLTQIIQTSRHLSLTS